MKNTFIHSNRTEKKKKKGLDTEKLKRWGLYALIMLVLLFTLKKVFLIILFTLLTFLGKEMRTALNINFMMFDPLVFFSILILKYMDFLSFIIFLFITVFLADAKAGNFTPGSFLNYFLFNICPIVGLFVFPNNLMAYGMFTAVLYSLLYAPIRVNFLSGDPFQTWAKAITNIVFVYLYLVFLGPLFELIFKLIG